MFLLYFTTLKGKIKGNIKPLMCLKLLSITTIHVLRAWNHTTQLPLTANVYKHLVSSPINYKMSEGTIQLVNGNKAYSVWGDEAPSQSISSKAPSHISHYFTRFEFHDSETALNLTDNNEILNMAATQQPCDAQMYIASKTFTHTMWHFQPYSICRYHKFSYILTWSITPKRNKSPFNTQHSHNTKQ